VQFSAIEDILADLRAGRMVIMVDDEDRENEGDLIMCASRVTADDINFMARHARGLICLTLTPDRCRQLRLPLMVPAHTANIETTQFTVSIDAAEDIHTGISAADRAVTLRKAVSAGARPEDFVQPGHVFPLMARPGGVLTRAGHTEAGCDLARLAGDEPAAVIVEILNEDGTMARRSDLEQFAELHGLKMGTIEDLIRYRLEHEATVQRLGEGQLVTAHGTFRLVIYRDLLSGGSHYALVRGAPAPECDVAVRVHLADPLCDLFGARAPGCGWPLQDALARLAREPEAVLVVLNTGEPHWGERLQRLHRLPEVADPAAEAERPLASGELRTYGVGAQILRDLQVRRMRVLSAPKRFHALSGFGLEVVDYIAE